MDKFKELDLKFTDGEEVNAPVLTDCPINIECEIVDSVVTGSHEMFIAEVKTVHTDEKYLTEDNKVDFTDINLMAL